MQLEITPDMAEMVAETSKATTSVEMYCDRCGTVLMRLPKGSTTFKTIKGKCDCSWACCEHTKTQDFHDCHLSYREAELVRKITDRDILDAIAQFELRSLGQKMWQAKGPNRPSPLTEWRMMDQRKDDNGQYHQNSVSWAIENYPKKSETLLEDYIACGDEMDDHTINSTFGMPAIYGLGGWNRYYVLLNGQVVFSAHHSDEKTCKEAEAAGFRIWR